MNILRASKRMIDLSLKHKYKKITKSNLLFINDLSANIKSRDEYA